MKKHLLLVLILLISVMAKAQMTKTFYNQPTIEFNITDISLFEERVFFIYNLVNDGRFDVKTSENDGVFLINADETFEGINLQESFNDFRQQNATEFAKMDKEQAAEIAYDYKSRMSDELYLSLMMDVYIRSRQNNTCANADPFCTDNGLYQFPAGVNAGSGESGPYYSCLSTQPNPAWYYMRIGNPAGSISIYMYSTPSHDIDFCCWGPFDDPVSPCPYGLTSDKVVSCSYSSSSTETCQIPASAQTGDYFILVITNYSNQQCNISFSKTGGTGVTDCGILPPLVNNDGPYCTGETIHLTANGQAGSSYHWTGPGNWTSSLQNPTRANATVAMSGTYTCTISLNGQTNSATTEVVVNQTPTANFSYTSVCQGSPTQFTAATTGNPSTTTYSWVFGDGQIGSGASINHTYANAGNYTVRLTTTNQGCTDEKTMTVPVYAAPVPTASANPQVIQYGQNSQLSAQAGASGSFNFHWEPANKVVSPNTQNTATVGLTETTTFTVTVTNPQGGCNATAQTTVSISGSGLTATATADNYELCEGETTTLHANPVNGAGNYTFSWSGPNNFSSTQQNPTVTPPVGQSTYTCQVGDGYSTVTATVSVMVYPNHTEERYITICENDTYNFFEHGNVSAPGLYESVIETTHGCDSTIRLHLDNWPTYDETTITVYKCHGESYNFYGQNYSATTNPATTYHVDQTVHGCDSIVRLALTVYPANDTILVDPTICESQSYNFHGTQYSHDGDIAYFDTIDNHGCLLVERLQLSVGPYQMPPIQHEYICYPYDSEPSFYWDKTGKTYHENIETDTILPDPEGNCDIKHRLDLKFHKEFYDKRTVESCDEYVWNVTGQHYTQTNHNIVAAFSTGGQFECDSIYVLDLTINKSDHSGSVTIDDACDKVVWHDNEYIYNGDYPFDLPTFHNCDSTVTLHIRNIEYTPKPNDIRPQDWNDPTPHWVIPATEFQINSYHYTVSDSNPNCSWDTVYWTCEEAPEWKLDWTNTNRSSNCDLVVLDRVSDTIHLTAHIRNRCNDTITQTYWLVCSFYDVEEQASSLADFTVIPNPNNGQMMLNFEYLTGKIDIKVYDMNGNLIDNLQTNNEIGTSSMTYDMKRHAPGIYFFVANGKEGTVAKKVVITR